MSKTTAAKAVARAATRAPARFSIPDGLKAPRGSKPREVVMTIKDFRALREAARERADLARHDAIMRALRPSDLIPIEVVEARRKGQSLIRAWRKERGLTLVELAKASGLSQPFISQLENGQKEATTTTLKKLATALRVEPGDLI